MKGFERMGVDCWFFLLVFFWVGGGISDSAWAFFWERLVG